MAEALAEDHPEYAVYTETRTGASTRRVQIKAPATPATPPHLIVAAAVNHTGDPTIPIKAALRRGFTFIWISDLLAAMEGRGLLPSKPALLTYDDGRPQLVTVAHPAISALQVKANVFLVSEYLYGRAVDASLPTPGMTWNDARTLHASGLYEWHNHTRIHQAMTQLSQAERLNDLAVCNAAIQTELGVPQPTGLAYPNGAYSASVVADLKTAGIKLAFDYSAGSGTQRFYAMDGMRYAINRSDKPDETWLDWAYDDTFYLWEWDSAAGRNSANTLGYWVLPTGGTISGGGDEIKLDSRTVVTAQSLITADYFRVRRNEAVYYNLNARSELQTAATGNGWIKIKQYDSAKAALADITIINYTGPTAYARFEGEQALDPNCRFIRIEVGCDAAYDGLVHMQQAVYCRAAV